MNELYKTLTFVAVALVLTGAAFVSTRDRTKTDVRFQRPGKALLRGLQGPAGLHRPGSGGV